MSKEAFQTPYPGYDVLDKWDSPSWNEATRKVVADRLENVPPRRFFSEAEFALLRVVMDCVLPQPERGEHGRIAVEAFVDAALFDNQGRGTRYAGTPSQQEAWKRGLANIEHEAGRRFGKSFADLSAEERNDLLKRIGEGKVDPEAWRGLEPSGFFRRVLLQEAVKAYYAHPFAWNEIGFGGPASPRGYVRLGPDRRDPWEAKEERAPQRVEVGQ